MFKKIIHIYEKLRSVVKKIIRTKQFYYNFCEMFVEKRDHKTQL